MFSNFSAYAPILCEFDESETYDTISIKREISVSTGGGKGEIGMMNRMIYGIRLLAICAVSVILASCATGNYLRTEESSSIDMKKTYSLIL